MIKLEGMDGKVGGQGKTICLKKLQLTVEQTFTGEALRSCQFNSFERFEDNERKVKILVHQLKTLVWAESMGSREQTVTFSIPRNWWQAFKQEKFPTWLLKKYPVQEKVIRKTFEVEQWACFPKYKTIHPDEEFAVHYFLSEKIMRGSR